MEKVIATPPMRDDLVDRTHASEIRFSELKTLEELEELTPADFGLREIYGPIVAVTRSGSTGSMRVLAIGG